MVSSQIDRVQGCTATSSVSQKTQAQGGTSFQEMLATKLQGNAQNGGQISSSQTQASSSSFVPPPGFTTLGYNGQNPPMYPPGYPDSLKNKIGQILDNPNIPMATKNQAWMFTVTGPSANGTYTTPSFNASQFWGDLIGKLGNNPTYTDLSTALKKVNNY